MFKFLNSASLGSCFAPLCVASKSQSPLFGICLDLFAIAKFCSLEMALFGWVLRVADRTTIESLGLLSVEVLSISLMIHLLRKIAALNDHDVASAQIEYLICRCVLIYLRSKDIQILSCEIDFENCFGHLG
jgi:hypothetical protein